MGRRVGTDVGRLLGVDVERVGTDVGRADGADVGRLVGAIVGRLVGAIVGRLEGRADGSDVGRLVGADVGFLEGLRVGLRVANVGRRVEGVGADDGRREGLFVCCTVTVGARCAVGTADIRWVEETDGFLVCSVCPNTSPSDTKASSRVSRVTVEIMTKSCDNKDGSFMNMFEISLDMMGC